MDTLCRLMVPELPQTVVPESLARKGETISGVYTAHDLPRLCAILHNKTGRITFSLDFRLDQDKTHCLISGRIEAEIKTVCQRCLNTMELNINTPVYLGIVSSQSEAEKLPEGCEPLLLDKNAISLSSLVEDEVILALPISAMHDSNKCAATRLLDEINASARNNPFLALKK